jgi:hypothetical protein
MMRKIVTKQQARGMGCRLRDSCWTVNPAHGCWREMCSIVTGLGPLQLLQYAPQLAGSGKGGNQKKKALSRSLSSGKRASASLVTIRSSPVARCPLPPQLEREPVCVCLCCEGLLAVAQTTASVIFFFFTFSITVRVCSPLPAGRGCHDHHLLHPPHPPPTPACRSFFLRPGAPLLHHLLLLFLAFPQESDRFVIVCYPHSLFLSFLSPSPLSLPTLRIVVLWPLARVCLLNCCAAGSALVNCCRNRSSFCSK